MKTVMDRQCDLLSLVSFGSWALEEFKSSLYPLEIESLPKNGWFIKLWNLHYKRELKEDNYTVRKQHYFFHNKNFEKRLNLEL